MSKCRFCLPVLVVLGLVVLNAPEASAQKGGRGGGLPAAGARGGGLPGGAVPGAAIPGTYRGGVNLNRYGNVPYGNRYGGVPYGGFYGRSYPGFYDPFWYGYGSPRYYNYSYSYPPNYFNYPRSSYDYAAPLVPGAQLVPAQVVPVQPPDQTAQIEVRLPRPDAKVWVDGNLMSAGSGTLRTFTSPDLESGYSYSYRISAAWMDNGQEVRVERSVDVAPGRVSLADFTKVDTTPRLPPTKD